MAKCEFCDKGVTFGIRSLTLIGVPIGLGNPM